MTKNYRAIIIAAGMGQRLRPLTEDTPKCMLPFGTQSLLQHQLDAFAACGISDISIIRGYKKEKINLPGIQYFDNDDFENNNILNSLFYAEPAITGDVVICYSDIYFGSNVVEAALQDPSDIAIVVDTDWRDYYVGRVDHPVSEAEKVSVNRSGQIRQIGKLIDDDQIFGEFIGMTKLSPAGCDLFVQEFKRVKNQYWDKPFQRAPVFQKAYMTDMFQELVDQGVSIGCAEIEKGWMEIDTMEDYRKVNAMLNDQNKSSGQSND